LIRSYYRICHFSSHHYFRINGTSQAK